MVMVTGGAGFIGTHLGNELRSPGDKASHMPNSTSLKREPDGLVRYLNIVDRQAKSFASFT